MEQFLKSAVAVVALISGLLTLGKGAIDLLKEYQTSKTALPALLTHRRFWIAAGSTLIGISVLIAVAWWMSSRTPFVLTVQLWDVELDQKHAILASQQFSGSSTGGLPDKTLQHIGTWVTEQIEERYHLGAPIPPDIRAHIHVPVDLSTEKVQLDMTPPGPAQIYFWQIEETAKSRIPLDEQTLAGWKKDFYLEIQRPGYRVKLLRVPWGKELNERFTLVYQSNRVGVGIEQFEGEKNSIATWLANYLTHNPRLLVKGSDALEVLRIEIGEERAKIARNPMVQAPIRASLGLDLIISGHYEKR